MHEVVNIHAAKIWLTPGEQVARLKAKGVRFRYMSEEAAAAHLACNNNYFRLSTYRTGFARVDAGPRKGQYANLDFGMLVDLSEVDTLLRREMLHMALDIEHFAKMELLGKIERAGEDGYAVVADFIARYDKPDGEGEVKNIVLTDQLLAIDC